MSPLSYAQCLCFLGSRERHCDCYVVLSTFSLLGHRRIYFPFRPWLHQVMLSWLHSYYGVSDCCYGLYLFMFWYYISVFDPSALMSTDSLELVTQYLQLGINTNEQFLAINSSPSLSRLNF